MIEPKISVITPCLNGARYIRDADESVLAQGNARTQHVVADAGSTDGTLEILAEYPHLEVYSSADRGIYDGLNRALQAADGALIGILNSDDCYAANAFSCVIEAFQDAGVTGVAGQSATFGDASIGEDVLMEQPSCFDDDLLFRATLGNPSINAWFFRSSVFDDIGRFDSTYSVAGDREFMLRFALSGLRYADVKHLVCRYRIHPGSMTFGRNADVWDTVLKEHDTITRLYLARPDLPKRARNLIARAHTRDTLSGAIYHARRHNLRKWMSHAAAGTRLDPTWPARFAVKAIRVLAHGMRL